MAPNSFFIFKPIEYFVSDIVNCLSYVKVIIELKLVNFKDVIIMPCFILGNFIMDKFTTISFGPLSTFNFNQQITFIIIISNLILLMILE